MSISTKSYGSAGGLLLERSTARELTFERDGGKCVFCNKAAVDAHHILERRLWPDGGYYLDNLASVCEEHHLACERTTISVEQVREACGITKPLVPPHLYHDTVYDKWGNPILPNGQRIIGELFFDESVQKVLKEGGVLGDFTNRVKYPRTHHVPWSPGITDDDRVIESMKIFENQRVVVTEKMDGENTTLYRDYFHARSVDSGNHPSRNRAKAIWASMSHCIPEGWRVCAENMYAKHSIAYNDLEDYLLGFSIWDDKNVCLSWDETEEWFRLLDLTPVKVLYDGLYDYDFMKAIWSEKDWERSEGYVLRLYESFPYSAFRKSVAKFVRKGHVQTVKHWMHGQPIVPNTLRD